jgi:hypothetical protein
MLSTMLRVALLQNIHCNELLKVFELDIYWRITSGRYKNLSNTLDDHHLLTTTCDYSVSVTVFFLSLGRLCIIIDIPAQKSCQKILAILMLPPNSMPVIVLSHWQCAPSRVTLHLGHLPSKKDIRPPWPRTPTRENTSTSYCTPPVFTTCIFQIDPNNPPWLAYQGYHEFSLAHATMSSLLPTILGKAVDDAVTTLNTESLEERVVDLAQCINQMGELMADLIIDDGCFGLNSFSFPFLFLFIYLDRHVRLWGGVRVMVTCHSTYI